jgi:tRNA modification GTPase
MLRVQLMKERFANKKMVLILNKLDSINGIELSEIQQQLDKLGLDIPMISLSAKSGKGVEELKNALVTSFNSGLLQSNDPIVSNARHYDALQRAYQSLIEVQQGMKDEVSSEFLAVDLRAATEALGLITGEITNDELLGNIFSQFCIGK